MGGSAAPLDELMNAARALHQTAYADHDLVLRLVADDDLPPAWADIDRLRHILINLLSNAVEFTPQGEVLLAVWAEDDRIVFEVRDTGPGIAQDELPDLFEPFQHRNGSIASNGKGTGLGLPVSRLLARYQSGDLTVRSALQQGSTFTLWLPRQPAGPIFPSAQRTAQRAR